MSLGTHKLDLANNKIARLTNELKTAKLEQSAAKAIVKDEKVSAKAKKSMK